MEKERFPMTNALLALLGVGILFLLLVELTHKLFMFLGLPFMAYAAPALEFAYLILLLSWKYHQYSRRRTDEE